VEGASETDSFVWVKTAEDGTTTEGVDAEHRLKKGDFFTLHHNESITIDMPLGKKIKITEDRNGFIMTADEIIEIESGLVKLSKEAEDEAPRIAQTGSTIEFTLADAAHIQVTNTTPTAPLTVTKTVTGGMGDRTKNFNFQLSIEDTEADEKFDWVKRDKDNAEIDSGSELKHNQITNGDTFTLKHGESMEILIPTNRKITVTETNSMFYIMTASGIDGLVKLNDSDEDDADRVQVKDTSVSFTIAEDADAANVSIINNRETVVPTGTTFWMAPYLAILVGGVALLLLKKRRR
jgi:hypothetical protein